MLRIIALSLILLTFGWPAYSADQAPVSEKTEAPQVKPKPRTKEEQKKIDEMRKHIDEKKTEMNGSSWEVTLASSDSKIKGEKDTFVFQDDQVTSAAMSKRGFGATNYTVSVPSETSDSGVWETMKTGKDGVIFIRGEWEKDKMSGNVTEQLDGGKKVKEYTFAATSRVAIPANSSKEPQAGSTESDVTSSGKKTNDNSNSKVLVSKEAASADSVASFAPGTTDEVRKKDKGKT